MSDTSGGALVVSRGSRRTQVRWYAPRQLIAQLMKPGVSDDFVVYIDTGAITLELSVHRDQAAACELAKDFTERAQLIGSTEGEA